MSLEALKERQLGLQLKQLVQLLNQVIKILLDTNIRNLFIIQLEGMEGLMKQDLLLIQQG